MGVSLALFLRVSSLQARMIAGFGPVAQAVLGTFLTWGLTAAGSALVFVFSSGQVSPGISSSFLASLRIQIPGLWQHLGFARGRISLPDPTH